MGKVKLQVVKEFEHQARQNLCTLNFLAAFNQVISDCNLIMGQPLSYFQTGQNSSTIGCQS